MRLQRAAGPRLPRSASPRSAWSSSADRTGAPWNRPDGMMRAPRRCSGLRGMSLPWPVRSVVAGAAGTTTMTLAYAAERRLRRTRRGPLDYDDSIVPGQIVVSVMHLSHVTDREDRELGTALRWSYGSAFGGMHGLLHPKLGGPRGGGAFCGRVVR